MCAARALTDAQDNPRKLQRLPSSPRAQQQLLFSFIIPRTVEDAVCWARCCRRDAHARWSARVCLSVCLAGSRQTWLADELVCLFPPPPRIVEDLLLGVTTLRGDGVGG